MIFNTTDILIKHFVQELGEAYTKTYGGLHKDYGEILTWAGTMALEIISNSDAVYHNVEHTIQVTLVGQEILRGMHIKEGGVTPRDWLHCIISFLCHDIGYVKGVCRLDDLDKFEFATGVGSEMVKLHNGSTDASLNPYHVNRGIMFVKERFEKHPIIDVSILQNNIENTRWTTRGNQGVLSFDRENPYPYVVRAADLIGQISDTRYLQKMACLYYEFRETGVDVRLGYKSPGDVRKDYPRFFWSHVYHLVKECIGYLYLTQNGKQFVAQVYANVFSVEHQPTCFPGSPVDGKCD